MLAKNYHITKYMKTPLNIIFLDEIILDILMVGDIVGPHWLSLSRYASTSFNKETWLAGCQMLGNLLHGVVTVVIPSTEPTSGENAYFRRNCRDYIQ